MWVTFVNYLCLPLHQVHLDSSLKDSSTLETFYVWHGTSWAEEQQRSPVGAGVQLEATVVIHMEGEGWQEDTSTSDQMRLRDT